MKHTFHYLLIGSAVLALAACGSSKGPGDIGSRGDIVIRNAGDPEPAAMAASGEAPVDPVIAQHAQAVENAQPVIDEMAAKDPDNTPVPGDQIEEPKAEMSAEAESAAPSDSEVLAAGSKSMEPVADEAEAMVSEEVAETVVEETITEAEEVVAQPMKRTSMVQPDAETILEPIDTQAHDTAMASEEIAEPVMEEATAVTTAAAPEPEAMPEAELPKPVYEGDPAVSDVQAMEVEAEQAETYTPSTGVTSGLIAHPSKGLISALQKALNGKGYYFGAMDGNLGAETLNALHLYQSAHGMSDYGMTVETLEKLGVDATQY